SSSARRRSGSGRARRSRAPTGIRSKAMNVGAVTTCPGGRALPGRAEPPRQQLHLGLGVRQQLLGDLAVVLHEHAVEARDLAAGDHIGPAAKDLPVLVLGSFAGLSASPATRQAASVA